MVIGRKGHDNLIIARWKVCDMKPRAIQAGDLGAVNIDMSMSLARDMGTAGMFGGKTEILHQEMQVPATDRIGRNGNIKPWRINGIGQ